MIFGKPIPHTDPDRVVLDMPMFSTIPESTLTELIDLFGEEVNTLGKDELTALSVCHIEGDVTNSKLQYSINLHKSVITKLLQGLCKSGHLISENKSRWTTYHFNPDFRNAHHFLNNDSSRNDDTSNDDSSRNDDTSNNDTSNIINASYLGKTPLELKIIEVCNEAYISIEEIATKVNRSVSHLKNKIIPSMIKNGDLVRLHPKINHPDQKYISK